ncbi:hypothetical protein [Salinispira pacifica]
MTVGTNSAAAAAAGANTNASYSFPLSSVLRATLSSDKVSVPVSNYTFFAQFKHFTPVPAGAGDIGFSIARLRVLDILVDRLAELRARISEGGLQSVVGTDAASAGRLVARASELTATRGAAGSATGAETRAVAEQLLAQYSSTLQATISAARQRPYGPTIPDDTGSALLVSAQA